MDADLVRSLQERSVGAFPPLRWERLGGWWLRHGDGGAWWAGSVLPHGDAGAGELVGMIRRAEEFYGGRATRFQISPGVCPAGLDGALAGRGYRKESPMSLQTAATAVVCGNGTVDDTSIRISDAPTGAWFEAWQAVHALGEDPEPEWAMLRRVTRPSAYVSAVDGSEVTAVGRAVVDDGWAGVFGMATLPRARGRGAAGRVLAALAGWAADHGAENMYLQVEPDNEPARRLYGRAGFRELCLYHYRSSASLGPRPTRPAGGAGRGGAA